MAKINPGERWKPVELNLGQVGSNKIEVSNFGRIRSFNKNSDGNILNGSITNGYPIIRLKLYLPHNEDAQTAIVEKKKNLLKLEDKFYRLSVINEKPDAIAATKLAIKQQIKEIKQLETAYKKARTINYHSLIHRLVATYFLPAPKAEQTVVAHLDFDKLNNRVSNLKWMTHEENVAHQTNSPKVIAELALRRGSNQTVKRNTKLTITKVMLLKKHLNEGRDLKAIVKQFKITETQVYRIKRGENWSDVPAAK